MTATLLKASGDRKVSPLIRNGKPAVRNSFGLPAGRPEDGGSCPGATAHMDTDPDYGNANCKRCYAYSAERSRPSIGAAMRHNLETLQGLTARETTIALDALVIAFKAECDKHAVPARDRVYRIHWDGDIFDAAYARAWSRVIDRHPDVTFWLYTRSFGDHGIMAPILATTATVYLSVDTSNYRAAAAALARYGDRVQLAIMAGNDVLASALATVTRRLAARESARSATVCPEVSGRLPLTVDRPDGTTVGACVACGLCIHGRRDVLFPVHR